MMKNADKLAAKHNLSVKVSCEKVEGTPTTMITVDVHSGADGASTRVCRYMTSIDVTDGNILANTLRSFREASIINFLGLEGESELVEETVVEETPKPTTKKKATRKKAVAKKEVVPEVAPDTEDDLSEFGDLEAEEEEATVPYSKRLSDHAAVLSPLLVSNLGADWKKDEAAKTKVRKLIVAIDGKVSVMTVSGAILNSFEDEVERLLA